MGIGMPVLSLNIKYLQPARYDDLLQVKVMVKEKPRARILFHYEILRNGNEVINKGETELVFIKLDSGRPSRIPEELENLLQPHFS